MGKYLYLLGDTEPFQDNFRLCSITILIHLVIWPQFTCVTEQPMTNCGLILYQYEHLHSYAYNNKDEEKEN